MRGTDVVPTYNSTPNFRQTMQILVNTFNRRAFPVPIPSTPTQRGRFAAFLSTTYSRFNLMKTLFRYFTTLPDARSS